jgi:hypothetical protein
MLSGQELQSNLRQYEKLRAEAESLAGSCKEYSAIKRSFEKATTDIATACRNDLTAAQACRAEREGKMHAVQAGGLITDTKIKLKQLFGKETKEVRIERYKKEVCEYSQTERRLTEQLATVCSQIREKKENHLQQFEDAKNKSDTLHQEMKTIFDTAVARTAPTGQLQKIYNEEAKLKERAEEWRQTTTYAEQNLKIFEDASELLKASQESLKLAKSANDALYKMTCCPCGHAVIPEITYDAGTCRCGRLVAAGDKISYCPTCPQQIRCMTCYSREQSELFASRVVHIRQYNEQAQKALQALGGIKESLQKATCSMKDFTSLSLLMQTGCLKFDRIEMQADISIPAFHAMLQKPWTATEGICNQMNGIILSATAFLNTTKSKLNATEDQLKQVRDGLPDAQRTHFIELSRSV